MSRVGNKKIDVPKGVSVKLGESTLEVQGPKGKLQTPVPPGIKFALSGTRAHLHARGTTSASSARSTGWRGPSPRTRSRA